MSPLPALHFFQLKEGAGTRLKSIFFLVIALPILETLLLLIAFIHTFINKYLLRSLLRPRWSVFVRSPMCPDFSSFPPCLLLCCGPLWIGC